MFNPEDAQPLNIFFDFEMGGLKRTYTPDPHIPVECSIRMKEVTEYQLTFYDETGFEVEPFLWRAAESNRSGSPKGTLKWGYTVPDKESNTFPIEAASYSTKFRKNCFALNLHGTISLAPILSSNQIHGTLKEICEKIADLHELDLEIDPPFDPARMMDAGSTDIDETQLRELRHFKLAHENDWRYLQRVLQYALDGEGKGNYTAYLTVSESTSKPILKICRPKENHIHMQYDLSRPDSPVIEFDPDVNFANVFGAFDTHENTYQKITGDTCKGVFQPQLTQKHQVTFGKDTYPLVKASPAKDNASEMIQLVSETIEDDVKSHAMRSRTAGSGTPYASMNRALNKHLKEAAGIYTARLTILGDPTLKPPINVELLVHYPRNYRNQYFQALHYTSGTYTCDEIHHEIRAGSYITVLYLQRSGSDKVVPPSKN